ncbi:MAG: 23S rRNA (adenine(2503)-C(2))-methyltransferase RlmN, partial [Bacteroidota bacterium]
MKKKLFGLTLTQLQDITTELGLPKFTAKQIADWIYKKDITSIAEMSNLSKKARSQLEDKFVIGLQAPETVQTSSDGTKKYLFNVGDAGAVESAYIPE